jgi:DNA-binding transcriptional LysR family regulator
MTITALPHPSIAPGQAHPDPLASSFATTYAGVVAFIAVAAEGSFARAADRLGIGRSAVSRSVQKLEDQLNVRLFNRTTRSTTLTHEGDLFYSRCHTGVDRIVEAVEEMRDLRHGLPRGQLRVRSAVGFGRKVVAPLLAEFLAAYPEVSIDMMLSDKPTDFISDRVDIAFRNGRLEDAEIIAKQIVPMQMLVCASPEYAKVHGLPTTVEELPNHHCINLRLPSGRIFEWEFKVDGQARKFLPPARLTFNDADLVLQAVVAGEGIAQMPGYLIRDELKTGALAPCLVQYAPDDGAHYICYLSRVHLPSRMRVFIDFMTTKIRATDLQCLDDIGIAA